MPVNQTIVDVLQAFGWNGNRQQPRSHREKNTTPLQPLLMFNGLLSQRIVRLSEESRITELCLQERSAAELIDRLFLTVLGRWPDPTERITFRVAIEPAYKQRRTGKLPHRFEPLSNFQPDWRKHLEPEQSRLMLAAQRRVIGGERPTTRLTEDFRRRVEDVVWALLNSPEFVVIP